MSAALHLAGRCKVALVTKRELLDGASSWAQGGIAAVLDGADSIDEHIRDTHVAGAGLCHDDAVRFVVERGRRAVEWLVEQGVPFTREHGLDGEDHLHLTREGGHSHRRIAHAADATGSAVQKTLVGRVKSHPNIDVLEWHVAIDLITSRKLGDRGPNRAWGAYALDVRANRVKTIGARFTLLACGGAGKVYLYTTNPDTSTGDGIAMGWRAGAAFSNLEVSQFHPSCLFHPHAKSFLISEAVRGEGGILKLPDGTRFMPAHDPRAELAPRDIVARAIDAEMKRRGDSHVLLDFSPIPQAKIRQRFPNIVRRTKALGYDPTKEPLPVVPAAHYQCGGVVADLAGHTALERLFAVGEVACTGLHGANRLASNSLLEAVVMARETAEACVAAVLATRGVPLPAVERWDARGMRRPREAVGKSANWDAVRRMMWDYVGIVRTDERLAKARRRLALIREEVETDYARFVLDADLVEVRNLAQVAELVVRCAEKRLESRGLHYNLDHLKRRAAFRHDTVIRRSGRAALRAPGRTV